MRGPALSYQGDGHRASQELAPIFYLYFLFFWLYPLGFQHLNLWCEKMMVLKMAPSEHKVMARAITRVRTVGELGVAPLEVPVTDRFSDSLVTKARRVA